MIVRRILNKAESKYYFLIIKESKLKTIQADNIETLNFRLNSKEITSDEYNACVNLIYRGKVEVFDGNI